MILDERSRKPTLTYRGDLVTALLKFLQDQPLKKATVREVYHGIRFRYDLPSEWMQPVESSNGEPNFENSVRWARERLCKHGLIHRSGERGVWKLTPKGIHTAPEDSPTPKESFKSRNGYTLDQFATRLQKLSRESPEEYEKLTKEFGPK